jgi:hypothetical protein
MIQVLAVISYDATSHKRGIVFAYYYCKNRHKPTHAPPKQTNGEQELSAEGLFPLINLH